MTNKYWAVVNNEGKYFSSNGKWTTNINLAYVYKTEAEAQNIAKTVNGKVVSL